MERKEMAKEVEREEYDVKVMHKGIAQTHDMKALRQEIEYLN